MDGQIAPCPAHVLKIQMHTSFSRGFSLLLSLRAMSFDTSLLEVFNPTLEGILCLSYSPILAGSWPCCPGQRPCPHLVTGTSLVPTSVGNGRMMTKAQEVALGGVISQASGAP